MPSPSIIGVYPVSAPEPCHLVEMRIDDCDGVFEIGEITQADSKLERANWQVPYDERLISSDGHELLTESFEAQDRPELWRGSVRLGFFFHLLNFYQPLLTPFGELELPRPSPLPERLSAFTYEEP
jgi:hypothetical protein